MSMSVRRAAAGLAFTIVAVVALLADSTVALPSSPQTPLQRLTFPSIGAQDPDTRSVTLGVRFTAARSGLLMGVEFHRPATASTGTEVQLWSSTGALLASASGVPVRAGWVHQWFYEPVPVTAGETYTASYLAPEGRYTAITGGFDAARTVRDLTAPAGAGVYAYAAAATFPSSVHHNADYLVTPIFVAGGSAPPPRPPLPPVLPRPPTAPPTAAPLPTTTPQPPPPGGTLNLARVPWEGGPGYYTQFGVMAAAGFDDPAFFPIGVWFESVTQQADIDRDKAAGLNTYVELTADSNAGLIRLGGMKAVPSEPLADHGGESVGWLVGDEVDMWGGPGPAGWTGNFPGRGSICQPENAACGYTVMDALSGRLPAGDGRARYANFGKGVMFWESDAEAQRFVNDWTGFISNDIYWYTDPNVCVSASEGPSIGSGGANCRKAANYGLTMDRMRFLDGVDGERQPVLAFVEVGHPFSEADAPTIDGAQIQAAVMSSLINEARGILYFNHNFGGGCMSQHVLRDVCGAAIRPAVTTINQRIAELAPVLNTQSYQWEFNPDLDTMLKEGPDGAYYIFSMLKRDTAPGAHTLTLPSGLSGATAEVLHENRSIPIGGGRFTDMLSAESSWHIYKITPARS